MDYTKVIEYLLGTSPMAALMLWLFISERGERQALMLKLEANTAQRITDAKETADRLIKLADTQRETIMGNTTAMTMLRDTMVRAPMSSAPDTMGGGRK